MAILVTGGAGFIGGHMVLELLDAGEKVVVIDDLSTGFDWAVPNGVPLIIGDCGNTDLVAETIIKYEVDEIIHFAAKIIVPESVKYPLEYYLNNTANSRSLIDASQRGGVKKIIFSSTAAVYGDPETSPIPESTDTKPLSPYGRSKLMVEWMLEDARKSHDISYVVLRYFNVAGADPSGRYGQSTNNATHLIKMASRAALGFCDKLQVYGTNYHTPDGTCLRDYIQVTDLVRAHQNSLEYLRAGGESIICNCGYSRGFSVFEVIESVKRVSGKEFRVDICPRRSGDPASLIASNDRIKNIMGWKPQYEDLDLIVKQALQWEMKLAIKNQLGMKASNRR